MRVICLATRSYLRPLPIPLTRTSIALHNPYLHHALPSMKTVYLSLLLSLLSILPTWGQVSVKDAPKAMLSVTAYGSDGKVRKTGRAFYVNASGHAVCAYTLLEGAHKAVVRDFKGREYVVHRIVAAESACDLVRFTVQTKGETPYIALTPSPVAMGTRLNYYQQVSEKKAHLLTAEITADTPYEQYRYYDTSVPNDADMVGTPLLDEDGKAVAILQYNVKRPSSAHTAVGACAIDARFVNDLRQKSTTVLSTDLRAIHIPKALPEKFNEAQTALYMMNKRDTVACLTAYNDFVDAWPTAPDGYVQRARFLATLGRYAETEADFQKAFRLAANAQGDSLMAASDVHHSFSELLYRASLSQRDTTALFPGWTLQRAIDEATAAYSLKPLSIYLFQRGKCLFASKDYAAAYADYKNVLVDPAFQSPEVYFAAARSLEMCGTDSLRVIALLDSAIAVLPKPLTAQSAQYYLERSQRLIDAGRLREAINDYNEYEKILGPRNLNDRFYYLRYQVEVDAHLYQQALDDLHTAIATAKVSLPYRLEEAFFYLRVGEYQQALSAAKALLPELPESPDLYRILGLAYGETGQKQEALTHLKKAQELGDNLVAPYIEKYSK